MPECKFLDTAHVDAVFGIEIVRRIERAVVMIDSFVLDVGVRSFPRDRRVLQVFGGNCKSAKGTFGLREMALHAVQVATIDDEAFEIDPLPLVPNLDPAMDDARRRQTKGQTGNRALLQRLVDCEGVKAAGDGALAEQ